MIATQPESRTMIMNVVNEVGRVYGESSGSDRRFLLDALKLFTNFPDVPHLEREKRMLDEWRAERAKPGKENGKRLIKESAKRRNSIRKIYTEVCSQHRLSVFKACSVRTVIRMVDESPQWKDLGFVENCPLLPFETIERWRVRTGFTDDKSPKHPKPSWETIKRVITSLHRKNSGS